MPVISKPIMWLPRQTANGYEREDVYVIPMTSQMVQLWKQHVQPIIDRQYEVWSPDCDLARVRADVGWDWYWIRTMGFLHSTLSSLPSAPSGDAQAYSIAVTHQEALFPIGMLTVVPKLDCRVDDQRTRGFAWYLSDAPKEVYEGILGKGYVHGIAKALLDCSVQATCDAGGSGELLLHADPKGGNKLIEFYEERCKMTRLELSDRRVTRMRRGTPRNEFFHWDAQTALEFCKQYDDKRIRTAAHQSMLR